MSLSKISTNFTQSGNTSSVTSVPLSGLVDQMKHKQPNGLYQTDNEFEQWQNDYNKWKEIAETSKNSQESTSTNENNKPQKYNDKKYIERIKKHQSKQKRKQRLRNLDNNKELAKKKAKMEFEKQVEKFQLSDIIERAKKIGFKLGFSSTNEGEWMYYGLLKDGKPHGIGISVTIDYLDVIDNQLLMYDGGGLIDSDTLDTSNLGGVVIHGDDQKQCNETTYDGNIKCIDTNSSKAQIYNTINDTFIDTKNNPNIDVYVLGLKMHGTNASYIYDLNDAIGTATQSVDELQRNGIKTDKPCLILKSSCFDARQRWYYKPTYHDDYDVLCKKLSNCTNAYTVCGYHNNNKTTHYDNEQNIFKSNLNYAYDLYKDGKLIQKNITAERMNEYMNYTLNHGTWDIPDGREKYIHFIEGLIQEIKKDKKLITGVAAGYFGVVGATAAMMAYCYKKQKCCFKEQPSAQNNNTESRPQSAYIGSDNNLNSSNMLNLNNGETQQQNGKRRINSANAIKNVNSVQIYNTKNNLNKIS